MTKCDLLFGLGDPRARCGQSAARGDLRRPIGARVGGSIRSGGRGCECCGVGDSDTLFFTFRKRSMLHDYVIGFIMLHKL